MGPIEMVETPLHNRMSPGEYFLLEKSEGSTGATEEFAAVIACPVCGASGLVTNRQLAGKESMICGSNECAAWYRIVDALLVLIAPN